MNHPLAPIIADPFAVDPLADTDADICLPVPPTDDGSLAVRVPTIDELKCPMVKLSQSHHQRLLAIEKSHRELTSTLLSMVACIQTHANSRNLNHRLVEDYLGEAVKTLAEARRLYR